MKSYVNATQSTKVRRGRRRLHVYIVIKRVSFWRRTDVEPISVCSLALRHKWRRADVIYDVGPMSKRRRFDVRNWRVYYVLPTSAWRLLLTSDRRT